MTAVIAFVSRFIKFKLSKADAAYGYSRVLHISFGPVSFHLGLSKVTIG